jgi:vesicle transport through interaction with t-SNAREs 1
LKLDINQIRKMDLEARSLQPSVKAGLLVKLREYKSDLNNIKNEVKRITSSNSKQVTREELLESGMADSLAVSFNISLIYVQNLQNIFL